LLAIRGGPAGDEHSRAAPRKLMRDPSPHTSGGSSHYGDSPAQAHRGALPGSAAGWRL